ncbi:MAG: GNAT family N-acetyltransferase [Candidatus Thermoplasmatota archaeon]|nr:GNAT family N-acetyltransferase [Candidatus Thermoplasmatota archaeon]
MSDVTIRRARAEDADEIVDLWKGFVSFLSPEDPRYDARPGAYDKWREYFLKRMVDSAHAALFVAEDSQDGLVGVIECRIMGGHPVFKVSKHGQLFGHFVREGHRAKGIGAQLIEAAETWFREQDLPYYRINVLAFLPEVKRAYEEQGMTQAEWVMEKEL